jgi:choline dehydrogenase-like flavoprotein
MAVLIVEEGRRHAVEEFRTGHPLDRFASLYREGGTTTTLGRPPILLPIGRGVGGTTLVNSGTCYRPPLKVLEHWRDAAGLGIADPDAIAPYLDDVWGTLQVAPVPMDVMGRNGEIVLAGAEKLGMQAAPITRNAPGCDGCCQCAIGCPRNAKFGVHLNALPQACAAGARIVSDARVERVLTENGRARGIVASRPDGSRLTIEAPRVLVAAGTTETPPLLRRSGLARHPQVGRNMAVHPAISVAGRFDEPVVAWHVVLQSAAIHELHESHGILAEATSTPPGLGSMTLPGYGRELLTELAGAQHLATLGAMIADESVGRVLGRNRAFLRYDLTKRDGGRLVEAIRLTGQVLLAAGANELLTGIPGSTRVRSETELDEALSGLDPRDLHVAAFHPVGTVGAGADGSRYPLHPDGRLRGTEGVWVADGSVLPTCPEVNPQVTIMALAMAIADGIVARE